MKEDHGNLKAALSPQRVDCPLAPDPPRSSHGVSQKLTALCRGHLFHDVVPVSNLDGFGVLDGDVAV